MEIKKVEKNGDEEDTLDPDKEKNEDVKLMDKEHYFKSYSPK